MQAMILVGTITLVDPVNTCMLVANAYRIPHKMQYKNVILSMNLLGISQVVKTIINQK